MSPGARQGVVLTGLFTVAFITTLLVQAEPGGPVATLLQRARPSDPVTLEAPASRPIMTGVVAVAATSTLSPAVSNPPTTARLGNNAAGRRPDPARERLSEQVVSELATQATSADDEELRRAAIQQLAVAEGPIAIDALSQALERGADLRERMMAAVSLGQVARKSDPDRRIERILRQAEADPDEQVAQAARDVLRQLSIG